MLLLTGSSCVTVCITEDSVGLKDASGADAGQT